MKQPNPSLRCMFALAITAGFLVTACTTSSKDGADATTVEQRFPINVGPQMRTLNVSYTSGAGMAPELSSELAAFAHEYVDRGNGAIAVSAPASQPDAQRYFADRLVSLGVPRQRILVGIDQARQPAQGVQISFIGYVAEAPQCGDWSVNVAYTATNETSPNFGCATQHNLAVMVADPRDFVQPRDLSPVDVQRSITVLDKYRKGDPTPSNKTDAQSGAIAAVGGGK